PPSYCYSMYSVHLLDRPLHLAHHHCADPAYFLGQDDARSTARILEAHRSQMFGAKERAVTDDGGTAAVAAESESAGAVGEDRVGDGAFEPVVVEVGGGADFDRDDERAVARERLQVTRRLLQRDQRGGA